MNAEELLSHASHFDFEIKVSNKLYTYKDEISINLRSNEDGIKKWAICRNGFCWDAQIKRFICEPSPSNRDDEFLKFTRFSLDDALKIVEELCRDGLSC